MSVVLYVMEAKTGEFTFVQRTESVKDPSPTFTTSLQVDSHGEADARMFKLSVFDVDNDDFTDKHLVGEAMISASDLLTAVGEVTIPLDSTNKKQQAALHKKESSLTLKCAGVAHARRGSVLRAEDVAERYSSLNDRLAKMLARQVSEPTFSLPHCVAYTRANLKVPASFKEFDLDDFVDELEAKYRFVSRSESGKVSLPELRQAVWESEEDNEGLPVPDGTFPDFLQEIVDEIWQGCGSKDFTFWEFVPYMLKDSQAIEEYELKIPPKEDKWAHA